MASLFYLNYNKDVHTLQESIFSQMRLCSLTLKCDNFSIDFAEITDKKTYELIDDDLGVHAYFPIPKSEKYLMKLSLSSASYEQSLKELQNEALWSFAFVVIILIIIATAFSLYALSPLKHALLMTQEFIKDILHDFNTPLSSLRLNTSMLARELPQNEKINRIEQSVDAILSLQEHLRSYLHNHTLQKELFSLQELLQDEIKMLEKNYPDIRFSLDIQDIKLLANKEALLRIVENILTNAAKYNRVNGSVCIRYAGEKLFIEDSGKGIKNPAKIYDRFYKEQERGLGIGLHIVKKLCDELGIAIELSSTIGVGSIFVLNLSKLIYK
jgi:signal transduction histidine kinase